MPNTLRIDPSRTVILRRSMRGDITAGFRILRGEIRNLIVRQNAFGLRSGLNFGRFSGLSGAAQLVAFDGWIRERTEAVVFETFASNSSVDWLSQHITKAYQRGVGRAWSDVRRQPDGLLSGIDVGIKRQFVNDVAFGIGRSRLEILQTRAFSELKAVADKAYARAASALADGLQRGLSARRITQEINEIIFKLEKVEVPRLVNTEVIRAHAEGQLDGYEHVGITQIEILAEWTTAGDDKVCSKCNPLEGIVLTIKQARGLIPRHFNCRCIFRAVAGVVDGQVWTRKGIEGSIRESLLAEFPSSNLRTARRSSRWSGRLLKVRSNLSHKRRLIKFGR